MSKIERRWKDTTIDWSIIENFDTQDFTAYCFNQQQVAILKAAILPYYWQTRWTEQTLDKDQLESLMSEIDYRLDIGCGIMLRQNSQYPCWLEQSTDGGATWSLAFDYSLCQSGGLTVISQEWNEYYTSITTNFAIYNGDITNIYPEWGYGDANDVYRDIGICWGLRRYIDWICDSMINALNDGADANTEKYRLWQFVEDALTTASNLMSDVFWYPGGQVVGGVLLLAANLIGSLIPNYDLSDIPALENSAARDEVVCLMYAALAGSTPTFTAWSLSADTPLIGDAEIVRSLVDAYNQLEENFVEWLGYTVGMITAAENGLIADECSGCLYWVQFFDFLVSANGFAIFPLGSDPVPHGTWVIAEGWTCDNWTGTAWECAADLSFPLSTITEATVWYESFAVRASQSDLLQVGIGTNPDGTVTTAVISTGSVNDKLSPGNYTIHGTGNGLASRFLFSTSFNSSQGAWFGTAMLKGTGAKPIFP